MYIYKKEFNRLITLKRENESFGVISYLNISWRGKNTLNVFMNMLREHLFDGCDSTTYVYNDTEHVEFHVDGFSVILHLSDDMHDWSDVDEIDVEHVLSVADASMISFEG